MFSRDQLVFLAYAAAITKSIRLGIAVIDPMSRHPVSIASSIATLSSLTRRELFVGLGSSQPEVLSRLSIDSSRPVEICKEAALIIKGLLSGEEATYKGEIFEVHRAQLRMGDHAVARVLIGAQGPKFINMTGEFADGLILPLGPQKYLKDSIELFFRGVEKSGRKKSEVSLIVVGNLVAAEDEVIALSFAKRRVAESISHLSSAAFNSLGIARIEAESYRRDPSKMPDHIAQELAICGSIEYCLERLMDLRKMGVSEFFLHNASLYTEFSESDFEWIVENTRKVSQLVHALNSNSDNILK